MSKKGILNLFILLLLIFSVALNSFSAAQNSSEKNQQKKEQSHPEKKESKEELRAASGFDALVPFAGVALEKDLYIISSFDYNSNIPESFSEEDNFRENKFFKTLICFFIAKKGP